jgi:4-hydroxythreonine-4-phosphate dehydrogenase
VKKDRIERTIRLIDRELRRWGIKGPRIAVAAVNPHGAEGGLFGIEEASELIPAIEACNSDPEFDVRGPFSADTVFLRASRREFDVVLSCYHDQGMIPVKCLSFGESVNVTLGLPFIRTSADHGTAFDIAGKGVADPRSMIEAIKLAARLTIASSETQVDPITGIQRLFVLFVSLWLK